MKDFSPVFNAHPGYIDSMYQAFQRDPESIESDWRAFFQGFDFARQTNGHTGSLTAEGVSQDLMKEFAVVGLIHGYRDRGHLLSTTNPLKPRKDRQPRIDLADYGLSDADLNSNFVAGFEIGLPNASLREIVDRLRGIYCGNIGFESIHISDKAKRMWLRNYIESRSLEAGYGFSKEKKRRILEKLNGAVGFEQFLHTKFVGQKRFSLEGGEATIPALDAIMNKATEWETPVEEVVIGMAHRGRLNVLANTLGKTYEQIFSEFEGKTNPDQSFGSGDVKYHMGFSSQIETQNGKTVYLKLLPNPSHLEAVDPVVQGYARAKADVLYESEYDRILPILIHGDAAVAGQGVVYEVAQMSQLRGYYTGGTIHLVINNQIGFTTSWEDGRSSMYCTAVAEVVDAPIFHVNGDDVEAVVFAVELATEYRQMFNSDVFIDLVCYRKYGHNESDEPRFTQPDLYALINEHPNPRDLYNQLLRSRGDVDEKLATEMELQFRADLQARLDNIRQNQLPYTLQRSELAWQDLRVSTPEDFVQSPETGVSRDVIDMVLKHLLHLPEGFKPLPQIAKLLDTQRKLVAEGKIDWALGELLAYGTLLLEGHNIRMSGQDVKRGTFSHRHAAVMDAETYTELIRLENISGDQGKFYIYNSLLSEYAVLGFEYGYSLASPNSLVLWEAQFGDFANGAHSIIDQFILAGESKWQRMSGIVLLLPHGYEGQGPEHSSARMERYLQGCAEYNVTVANLTSASNYFHLLRRQVERPFRKPLIIMTPKSALRPPFNLGAISEIEPGTRFQELLDDPNVTDPTKVKRVLVCSGKIYYDLLKRQLETKRKDVAILRLEQIYPFPIQQFEAALERYGKVKFTWVQEEPYNMGAWGYIATHFPQYNWACISRPEAASPATGYPKKHEQEQLDIVDKAFKK